MTGVGDFYTVEEAAKILECTTGLITLKRILDGPSPPGDGKGDGKSSDAVTEYPAYPSGSESGDSSDGKYGYSLPSLSRMGEEESKKAPKQRESATDAVTAVTGADDPLAAFLESPPAWFLRQAAICAREGSPDKLMKPLANAVSEAVFETTNYSLEVRTAVMGWLKGRAV